MDPLKIEEMLESFDNELKEKDQNDPWLVYISDKGKNSCFKCTKNHGKRFRETDLSKPALPIHPNCRCKYEKLNNQTARKVIMRSATVRADDSPGLGGIRVSNINDMLDKLEKEYASGTISELIISNHGEFPGEFEIGGKADRLDLMSSTQIERLKKLLSPNAIIDIRMCYGIGDKNGEKVTQDLADKFKCRIRAYANQVSPFGTRPLYSYDATPGIPFYKRFFVDPAGKIFYPQK